MRQKRRSYRDDDDEDEDALSENLDAVNERLDELTRQLERMAQAGAGRRAAVAGERAPDRVADALAKLDRRLDQVIGEGRAASQEIERRSRYAPPPAAPPAPPPQPTPPAGWAAQISARQRALEGGAAATPAPQPQQTFQPQPVAYAPPPPPPPPQPQPQPAPQQNWAPGPDLSELHEQLREINSQISSLHQPYEDGLAALRNDLAEIGRTLTAAMPRQAIEALEADVRALAERLDRSRQAGTDGEALATLENGLAEVRDALRGLTPAENLVGFEDAVHALSHKIDQIAASAQPAQDPIALKQLEQAVVSLRGVVANVASDGALAQLAAEVRTLAGQFERAAADSGTEALAKLDARITALMESGRAVPPELEGSIQELCERLDRIQLSQGDQLALGALEDRIAQLSEKLDASDARLKHLDAIERGLADLLVYLEDMRSGGPRGLRATPVAEPEPPGPRDAPQPSPASLLDLISELPQHDAPPAAIQAPAPEPAQPPPQAPMAMPVPPMAMSMPLAAVAPSAPPPADLEPPAADYELPQPAPQAQAIPRPAIRRPIDPNLPPDTPLEPGSGTPRVKPGSPAARIAASEAALGHARPLAAETGGKAAALAAARNAMKAAYVDTPAKAPRSPGQGGRRWFRWRSKKAPEAPPPAPEPAYVDTMDARPSAGRRLLTFLKKLLLAASVAIIVIGAVQTALELLLPATPSAPPTVEAPDDGPPPANVPMRPMPTPQGSLPTTPGVDHDSTGSTDTGASFFDPSTIIAPKPPRADVTGSIERPPAPSRPTQATATHPAGQASGQAAGEPMSNTFGPVLSKAIADKNPAAEYELGARYAEGRGVRQNPHEAVRWLERAAEAGFAPAQFRLASLNEKGDGLKKDVQTARRLYLAAATKGHAKAMHNLAVLYAEGIGGKPDYKVAAQWFRKAAGYGVADSQYNLAILYARGIGVTANLAESYKWFALAAAKGDRDAAHKRDEVAARLDPRTLTAAKLAVQTFVAEHEPEEAIGLRAPPGGWDRAPSSQAKPRPRPPRH